MAKGDEDDLATTRNIIKTFYNYFCSLIEAITTTPVADVVYMSCAIDNGSLIFVTEPHYTDTIASFASPRLSNELEGRARTPNWGLRSGAPTLLLSSHVATV